MASFPFLHHTDEIIEKIKSYSHGEFNKPDLIEKNLIEFQILKIIKIFSIEDINFKKSKLIKIFQNI